jgi:hypothetical protein
MRVLILIVSRPFDVVVVVVSVRGGCCVALLTACVWLCVCVRVCGSGETRW